MPGAGSSSSASSLDATARLWEHYNSDDDGSGPAPLPNYLNPALACARVPIAGRDGVKEGRGIVARREIGQGELLMVVKPLVSASVGAVYDAFRAGMASGGGEEGAHARGLEALVEDEMVKELRRLLVACPLARRVLEGMADGRDSSRHRGSGDGGGGDGWPLPDLELLIKEAGELQQQQQEKALEKEEEGVADKGKSNAAAGSGRRRGTEGAAGEEEQGLEEAWLRAVLRHNAHGPEFKGYAQIEHDWRQHLLLHPPNPPTHLHPRLGGLYPLPSLLNHACIANACRVFLADGTMLVRATQVIPTGAEVRWPYIPPLQPYSARQAALQAAFGFQCRCPRCRLEGGDGADATSGVSHRDDSPSSLSSSSSSSLSAYAAVERRVGAALGWVGRGEEEGGEGELEGLVEAVEELLQAIAPASAEHRRWGRASFVDLYFALFNTTAPPAHSGGDSGGKGGDTSPHRGGEGKELEQEQQQRMTMARLRNELHLALVAVNNCSTEHLSLLHACYEAAGHQDGVNSKLSRFWLNQLTTALQTRYGPPPSVDALRRLLQHTRLLLRTRDGYRRAGAGGGKGVWFL